MNQARLDGVGRPLRGRIYVGRGNEKRAGDLGMIEQLGSVQHSRDAEAVADQHRRPLRRSNSIHDLLDPQVPLGTHPVALLHAPRCSQIARPA